MLEGLNENHARSLLASVRHAAQLIRDCEEVLSAAEHPQPLSRYTAPLSPPQQKIARDYLLRLRQQLLRFLEGVGLPVPAPSIDSLMALNTGMMFLDDAFEEMRGRYLRGYGPVPPTTDQVLEGLVSELQALAREAAGFLTGAPSEVLRRRVNDLPDAHPVKVVLDNLLRIITDYGLVDLRPTVGIILDRAAEDTFEVAIVGRVSSGKSSLLNALIGTPVLPAGVLPVTAFPTRVRRGPVPLLQVTTANSGPLTAPAEEIAEFVTEAKNPGNEKRLTRLIVEYPSERLPERVTFVDTPGLGSLASSGALQTFAYLPNCDHATFLLEATSPVSQDDLSLLVFLRDAGISTSVLLSKADLLTREDLAKVRTYVSGQLVDRLGAEIPVRPVSAEPAFGSLLEAWIREEVHPLGDRARLRVHEGVMRKAEHLRRLALSALELIQGSVERRHGIDTAAAVQRLRNVSAAIEQTTRDIRGIGDHRADLVATAVQAATEVYAEALSDKHPPAKESVRLALTRPMNTLAEQIAKHLATRAQEAHDALRATIRQLGSSEHPEDTEPIDREVPMFDLPPVSVRLQPPAWARLSRSILTSWIAQRLQLELGPPLERAAAAYIDVLKRWAADAIARIRRDFESQSRPILTSLSGSEAQTRDTPDSRDPDVLRRDLAWLRQEGPDSSRLYTRSSSAAGQLE